jgi:hypothetical protein
MPFAGKPSGCVVATTDAVLPRLAEDERMPSIWIILAAAVGAINLRLMIPGIAAFLGIGKWSVSPERSRRLTT